MTTMNITVVANDKKSAKDKNGKPYSIQEIAYRNNSFDDKLESTKILQYNEVFSKAAGMKPGEKYVITKEKNAGGFWQWEDVVQLPPGEDNFSAAHPTPPPGKASTGFTLIKSTYETPEERAKKQVYIVKQSSITAALKYLELTKAKDIGVSDTLEIAQQLTDWVFGTELEAKAKPLSDMEDDVPF